jgi:hypothetical protein
LSMASQWPMHWRPWPRSWRALRWTSRESSGSLLGRTPTLCPQPSRYSTTHRTCTPHPPTSVHVVTHPAPSASNAVCRGEGREREGEGRRDGVESLVRPLSAHARTTFIHFPHPPTPYPRLPANLLHTFPCCAAHMSPLRCTHVPVALHSHVCPVGQGRRGCAAVPARRSH